MTHTKQTVCIATEETKKKGYNVPEGFVEKYGYFFTPEQLNQLLSDVIKDALSTAAEKVKMININADGKYTEDGDSEPFKFYVVNRKSITNTAEETLKKFEV